MHRIRLREPWAASSNEDSREVVYVRNFHRPTGAEGQTIALQVTLFPEEAERRIQFSLNGSELEPQVQPAENPSRPTLRFLLNDLKAYNTLKLRIFVGSVTIDSIRTLCDPTSIPTFGSFVVESVELQIE